jgi:hypothetical protein
LVIDVEYCTSAMKIDSIAIEYNPTTMEVNLVAKELDYAKA